MAKLTRQNSAPPSLIGGESPAGASTRKIVGPDVMMRQPFRRRGIRQANSRACALGARIDEIVHPPRNRADVEQRLDALASGASEIGAPIGRVQEFAERRRDRIAIARVRDYRARAADLG